MALEAVLDVDIHQTSVQTRANRTATLALEEMDRLWLPVRRHWRLNERHYGALQGLDKKETAARHGAERVKAWRRGYATPPPPLHADDQLRQRQDPRYREPSPDPAPATPRRRRRRRGRLRDRPADDTRPEGGHPGTPLPVSNLSKCGLRGRRVPRPLASGRVPPLPCRPMARKDVKLEHLGRTWLFSTCT